MSLSLSLYIYIYICHNFHLHIFPTSFCTSFVPSFLKIHIFLNFWATIMLKTVLGSLFSILSPGYKFTPPISVVKPVWNRRFMIFPTSFSASFVMSFLELHIFPNLWATTILDSFGKLILSHGSKFTAVNRWFWQWNWSEIADFRFLLQFVPEFYKFISSSIFKLQQC